jgi:hypothetical protein
MSSASKHLALGVAKWLDPAKLSKAVSALLRPFPACRVRCADQIAQTNAVLPPLHAQPGFKLRLVGEFVNEFALAENDLPKASERLSPNDFGDDTISVGHIYFRPGTRAPPIPPFSVLDAYKTAHPNAPIVVDTDRSDPCEDPHFVFARFVNNLDNKVGAAANDGAIVRLFTVAAGSDGVHFDMATHFKDGVQYEGTDVFEWDDVNFNTEFTKGGNGVAAVYRSISAVLWPPRLETLL